MRSKPAGPFGEHSSQPALTALRPPLRSGRDEPRRAEYPAAELAGAAVPVPRRDGRSDQHVGHWCRRAADLRRRADPALGERRGPLAVTRLPACAERRDRPGPSQLGFIPNGQATAPPARIDAAEAFRSKAELVDTLDLARMVTVSDIGQGMLDTLQEAAELLCRAYPSASAAALRARTKQRLSYISRLLHGRLTLAQHHELLVTIGWLALLLGCVHYDLGERELAEAARQAAYQTGLQVGHGEIIAWPYEMAAWFALTEGRYHDVVDYARAGQQTWG